MFISKRTRLEIALDDPTAAMLIDLQVSGSLCNYVSINALIRIFPAGV